VRGAQQSSVLTEGIAKEIFFDHLGKHGFWLSDGAQTEAGKSFWERRAGEAFGLGYKVGFLKLTDKVPMVCSSVQEFNNNLYKYYGNTEQYHNCRLFIES